MDLRCWRSASNHKKFYGDIKSKLPDFCECALLFPTNMSVVRFFGQSVFTCLRLRYKNLNLNATCRRSVHQILDKKIKGGSNRQPAPLASTGTASATDRERRITQTAKSRTRPIKGLPPLASGRTEITTDMESSTARTANWLAEQPPRAMQANWLAEQPPRAMQANWLAEQPNLSMRVGGKSCNVYRNTASNTATVSSTTVKASRLTNSAVNGSPHECEH
jgi:hypothetical protein